MKATTKEEQLRTVEELKRMGILPETEDPADYPPLATGQTWVSRRGVAYMLVKKMTRGWAVEVVDRGGKVTASSTKPWKFTDKQFRGLIQQDGLRLYDPTPRIDSLAQRLENRGHQSLASSLDQISREYFGEARLPQLIQKDRVNRATEQVERLKEEIKKTDDPEEIIKLTEELDDAAKILDKEGSFVSPADKISNVNPTSGPDQVSEPDYVSR